jgi:hypothetical protein
MREARINLPVADNEGRSLARVAEALEARLAHAFGGFTATAGRGAWINAEGRLFAEPVTVYDVAIDEEDDDEAEKLLRIAQWLKAEARQEAVYVRLPSGRVHFA